MKAWRNSLTIEQVQMACRHVIELMGIGVSENYAIRTLELYADNYAKVLAGSAPSPHKAYRVDRMFWSDAAKEAVIGLPKESWGARLRVEHGTPRRGFARMVLESHKHGRLTKGWLDDLCRSRWQLAVITRAEDKLLNRSAGADTPTSRWKAAGIKFSDWPAYNQSDEPIPVR